MKRFRFFQNASLRKKLVYLYIIFAGLPTILLFFVGVPLVRSTIVKREYENRLQLLSVMSESVELQMEAIEHEILQLYNLHGIFHYDTTSPMELRKELYGFLAGQSYIRHLLYVTSGGEQYSVLNATSESAPYSVLLSVVPELTEEMEKANGKIVWLAPDQNKYPDASRFVVCGAMIKNIYDDGHKTVGYAYFLLGQQAVANIFDSMRLGENDTVCVFDQNGNPVWKSHEESFPHTRNIWEGYDIICDQKGIERFYVFYQSEKNNWLFFYSTPLSEINFFSTIFFLSLCVIFLFLALCLFTQSVMVSHVFIRPMQKLSVNLDLYNIEKGGELKPAKYHDEIGILTQSIIQMQRRIQTLLSDIQLSHKKELEQELAALQSQINPHFIYNTLDAIGWMARERNQMELNKVLIRFSRILRYSISDKKKSATIREEVEWAKEYISLLQMRKPGAFSLTVHGDESLYEYYTLRLILQPFLENAVLHGFKHMEKGGNIIIQLSKKGNDINITITDNGQGIPKDRLYVLCSNIENGIGIYNVHRRLRIRFGEKYGVSVCSSNGTQISILLPQILDPDQLV